MRPARTCLWVKSAPVDRALQSRLGGRPAATARGSDTPGPAALFVHRLAFACPPDCSTCNRSTTVFSHAQTAVMCAGCATVLSHPTGGKASITDGCAFRPKPE